MTTAEFAPGASHGRCSSPAFVPVATRLPGGVSGRRSRPLRDPRRHNPRRSQARRPHPNLGPTSTSTNIRGSRPPLAALAPHRRPARWRSRGRPWTNWCSGSGCPPRLHCEFGPALHDWYGTLEALEPSRSDWTFPAQLPTGEDRDRYDLDLFDSWMTKLPRSSSSARQAPSSPFSPTSRRGRGADQHRRPREPRRDHCGTQRRGRDDGLRAGEEAVARGDGVRGIDAVRALRPRAR